MGFNSAFKGLKHYSFLRESTLEEEGDINWKERK